MLTPLRCSCVPECAGWIRGVNVSVQWKIIGQSIHPAQTVQPSAGTAMSCDAACMALSAERGKFICTGTANLLDCPQGATYKVFTYHPCAQQNTLHGQNLHLR